MKEHVYVVYDKDNRIYAWTCNRSLLYGFMEDRPRLRYKKHKLNRLDFKNFTERNRHMEINLIGKALSTNYEINDLYSTLLSDLMILYFDNKSYDFPTEEESVSNNTTSSILELDLLRHNFKSLIDLIRDKTIFVDESNYFGDTIYPEVYINEERLIKTMLKKPS